MWRIMEIKDTHDGKFNDCQFIIRSKQIISKFLTRLTSSKTFFKTLAYFLALAVSKTGVFPYRYSSNPFIKTDDYPNLTT